MKSMVDVFPHLTSSQTVTVHFVRYSSSQFGKVILPFSNFWLTIDNAQETKTFWIVFHMGIDSEAFGKVKVSYEVKKL